MATRVVRARRRDRGDRAPGAPLRPRGALAPRGGRREQRGRLRSSTPAARWRRRRDRGHRARDRDGHGRGPARGRRGGRRRGRSREGGLPARGDAVEPGERAATLRGLADAIEAEAGELATIEARNAGKPIADARGEIGMVVECFRYYAGAPGAAARQDDPGGRRRRHDVPRAARRGRPDRALELPAGDRVVEGGAGAGRGEHGRPEAGRADPAHGAGAASGSRSRRGCPRAS